MKTIFFTKLVPFLGAMNLTFTVAQGKEDTLIVSILPQPNIKDSSKSNITPLIIKGTADELDEGFFEHIQQPLEKVTGICVNIKDFEANAEKLKKESSGNKG
jgi:PRTRC genetic system protein E